MYHKSSATCFIIIFLTRADFSLVLLTVIYIYMTEIWGVTPNIESKNVGFGI